MVQVTQIEDNAPPMDRRRRRSRTSLQDALMTLVEQQDYPEITVDDVVRTADVARATFYAHYADKDALLAEAVHRAMKDLATLVVQVSVLDSGAFDGRAVLEVLLHVREHPGLYRAILGGAGADARRETVKRLFLATVEGSFTHALALAGIEPRLPVRLVARLFVGEILAIVEAYAHGDLDDDPVDATSAIMHVAAHGMPWALGVADGQVRHDPDGLVRYALARGVGPGAARD